MENKRNRVLLCLGSNWDKEKNMERAAEMLRAHFVFIQFSQPVYTEPIDCPLSTTFLNRVAVLYSEESPAYGRCSILYLSRHPLFAPDSPRYTKQPLDSKM